MKTKSSATIYNSGLYILLIYLLTNCNGPATTPLAQTSPAKGDEHTSTAPSIVPNQTPAPTDVTPPANQPTPAPNTAKAGKLGPQGPIQPLKPQTCDLEVNIHRPVKFDSDSMENDFRARWEKRLVKRGYNVKYWAYHTDWLPIDVTTNYPHEPSSSPKFDFRIDGEIFTYHPPVSDPNSYCTYRAWFRNPDGYRYDEEPENGFYHCTKDGGTLNVNSKEAIDLEDSIFIPKCDAIPKTSPVIGSDGFQLLGKEILNYTSHTSEATLPGGKSLLKFRDYMQSNSRYFEFSVHSLSDGQLLWKNVLPSFRLDYAAVTGDLLILCDWDHVCTGWNWKTADKIWTVILNGKLSFVSTMVGNQWLVGTGFPRATGTYQDYFSQIDLEDGKVIWSTPDGCAYASNLPNFLDWKNNVVRMYCNKDDYDTVSVYSLTDGKFIRAEH